MSLCSLHPHHPPSRVRATFLWSLTYQTLISKSQPESTSAHDRLIPTFPTPLTGHPNWAPHTERVLTWDTPQLSRSLRFSFCGYTHRRDFGLIMSFFGTSTSTTPANTAADKDVEVADPPGDSISSLAFSPAADYLAVGSWDNNVCHLTSTTRVKRAHTFPLCYRSEYTRSTTKAKARARLLILMMVPFWMFSGVKMARNSFLEV